MTIEPIASMMTVQAQGSVVQKPQTSVQTERPNNADSSVPMAEQVDRTTSVVENAQEKGQTNGGEQQGREQQATNEQIRKAVEKLNKNMANSEAVFGIHEDTNRVTIKIIDKGTKEVIREMAGILIDEKR